VSSISLWDSLLHWTTGNTVTPRAVPHEGQQPLPVQPVEKPILCGPYDEPAEHWVYTTEGDAIRMAGRRPASYWFKTQRVGDQQMALFAEETREDLPLVNALRADVKRWRASGYEGATEVTKELLRYWWRSDRPRRLFFCQLEAAETVIFPQRNPVERSLSPLQAAVLRRAY